MMTVDNSTTTAFPTSALEAATTFRPDELIQQMAELEVYFDCPCIYLIPIEI
jgi:hypothetical protein